MKHLNKSAQAIFETLTDGLVDVSESNFPEKQTHRTFGEDGGAFMAVHVERIRETEWGPIYSIAHYYKQNGDMVCDPDMTFLLAKTDGLAYPLTFEQGGMLYQESVVWSPDEQRIASYHPKMQRDQTSFANKWMMNIGDQQGLTPCCVGSKLAR